MHTFPALTTNLNAMAQNARVLWGLWAQNGISVADIIPMLDVGDLREIVGCSSDHTIVDVTDSGRAWKSGDTLTFRMRYSNMLYAFTGDHVTVQYHRD